MKKIISLLFLFLWAGCGSHHGGDPGIDPQINSGKLEVEDTNSGLEPIKLVDEDLNAGSFRSTVLNPVFFQYDDSKIGGDQVPVLLNNAKTVEDSAIADLLIEGHCDERGTEEYNLALGDRRAKAAKDYLVSLGIDGKRIRTISYGENHPFEIGHDESAWKLNRRAQFVSQE